MFKKFLKELMSLFAPSVIAPVTVMGFTLAQPAQQKKPDSKFHHLLGNFDDAVIVVKGKEVDLKELRNTGDYTAAKNGLSERFRIVVDDQTFVLWNNPNAAQTKAQMETSDGNVRRHAKNLGSLYNALVSLNRHGVGIESIKPSTSDEISIVSKVIREQLYHKRRSQKFDRFRESNPPEDFLNRMSPESRMSLDNN